MRHPVFRAAAIAALIFSPLPCEAQAQSFPRAIQTTAFGKSSITTGGTAQTVTGWVLVNATGTFGLPNVFRCIQNPGAATEDLFVAMGGTASATSGQDLPAGGYWCGFWPGPWSIYAATTGHVFLMSEYQF